MADPLWEALGIQFQPHTVCGHIGESGQAIQHAEDKQHRGVNTKGNCGIAAFHLVQGGACYRDSLRHGPELDASSPPRIADVLSELGQGAAHRYWHVMCDPAHLYMAPVL